MVMGFLVIRCWTTMVGPLSAWSGPAHFPLWHFTGRVAPLTRPWRA